MSYKRCFMAVTLLIVVMIFSFSLYSGAASHTQSAAVEGVVTRVLRHYHMHLDTRLYEIYRPFTIRGEAVDETLFFRKSAHLTEYFLLGVFSSVLLYWGAAAGKWRPAQFAFFFLGPLTALADEKIIQQYLTVQRTSTFKDVLLDSIGFYLAVTLYSALYSLIGLSARTRASRSGGTAQKTACPKPADRKGN